MKRRNSLVSPLISSFVPASSRTLHAHIARLLVLVLAFGSTLSVAASWKDTGNSKRLAYHRPSTRKGPGPGKTKPTFAARVQAASLLPGQTVTLLPDGRSLLIGGESPNGPQDEVSISDARTGQPILLRNKLHRARSWHSATMLPDGRILILGGIGDHERFVSNAEIFDPERQSFTLLPVVEMAVRAYHTATLLTDGQVLITGGSSAQAGISSKALLWDFKNKTFRTLPARLSAPRQKHKATLLLDGNVLIEGGTDGNGNPVTTGELFHVDAANFNFSTISSEQMDQGTPFLAGSLPANGASGVPVDSYVALRFSKQLRVETLNSETLILTGPEGTLEIKVVPAETGRLAFVTPKTPLLPGVTYTISVAGAVDESGRTIAPAASTFTTKKSPEADSGSWDTEDWIPDGNNLHGNWQRKHKDSPWRSLPLLQAEDGVTALTGQVLMLDGKPLNNVTLRIADRTAQTDNTGRFLLSSVTSGHQVMQIDGRTASRNKKVYGIFKVGVEIKEGKTNALGYTIWMPRLDMARAKVISSPTTTDTVVTNPGIPGLELRLPRGTVIRDVDGQTVTQVSITPIPTNQPPFPLPPNVDVPVYFTIQPGGSQIIPPRAQLIYPNFINSQPGARIDFYNYDPSEKGWYIYGQGTVTADGKQIVPDAGVTLYEFSGAMVAVPALAPSTFVQCGRGNFGGSSVDLNSGLFLDGRFDLLLPGLGSLALNRIYRPNDTRSRAFGVGSSHIYDTYLVGDTFPYTFMDLVGPDGSRIRFNRSSPGTGYADAEFEPETCGISSCAVKARIRWNGGGWIVIYEDGTKLLFPEAFNASTPQRAAIIGYEDRYGNALSFVRDSAANLTRIAAPSGRWMEFTYDVSNWITQARDNISRVINYSYDIGGRLASVTNPVSGVRSYAYDALHRMTEVTDERGITVLKNEYDSGGKVIKQTFADNTPELTDNPFYTYSYTLDSGGRVIQTDVTDPRGILRRVMFDANGYTTSETYAVGLPEQQTVTYERQAETNFLLSVTDHIGRKVAYTYDSADRITGVTSLAGTAEALTTHYGYTQDCECDDVISITDPLNHTSTFDYDNKHNLIAATDPLSNAVTFTYNAAGQPLSAKDALNNTTQLTYENGDLMAVTDPRGQTGSAFIDSAGRLLSSRAPTGQASRYEYDALDRPVKVIDAQGGITEFTYDANSNLLSVKDARNNVTSYTYDNVNRLSSRTYPLQRVETYEYDVAGLLKKFTDRRGKAMSYMYDNLDRVTFVGFGTTGDPGNPSYESTITYTYDPAGRLTQMTDSVSGPISYTHDNFDRVTSKATPQGTINYTYDAAGRRTSITVAGQNTVNYTYDSADRLTQITQGTRTVSFAYDNASRPTSIAQSNGIIVEYSYDQASNLTGIVYKKDATVLGNLTYEYDSAGKRTKMGGSFARTGLPQVLTSAAYNQANQLTQRAAVNLSYDNNGNLTSDGVNTYSWNARNQLASMSGPGLTASFQYDVAGQRINKTLNGVSTSYLSDGANAVQELSGATPTANMLTGGVDQVLLRNDAPGVKTPLTDGLGSTLGLADDAGTLQTQYTYDPFGNTTSTGTTSTNSSKYTGREEDGTGLYYYRARYYSPSLQRFISEDPIGFGGGDINLYAHVGNDPVNLVDPSGLCAVFSLLGLAKPYVDEDVLNSCTEDYFGVTKKSFTPSTSGGIGSFTGTGPNYLATNPRGGGFNDTFTVWNNASLYDKKFLLQLSNQFRAAAGKKPHPPGETVSGTTNRFSPLTNYTANNLGPMQTLMTQVHELGHSLDVITAIGYDSIKDDLGGDILENCVRQRRGFRYK